jgi:hypothetical protein
MPKDLDSVVTRLQAIALAMDTVQKADAWAKATYSQNVFAVSYPVEGSVDSEQIPATRGIHTIVTEVHYVLKTFEKALENSTALIEEFSKDVLADPTLAGTCDTVVGPIQYKFGYLNWGGQMDNHIGPRFFTTVKIRATS